MTEVSLFLMLGPLDQCEFMPTGDVVTKTRSVQGWLSWEDTHVSKTKELAQPPPLEG
jgi:hypothetical protein